jgi:hypothetical protein
MFSTEVVKRTAKVKRKRRKVNGFYKGRRYSARRPHFWNLGMKIPIRVRGFQRLQHPQDTARSQSKSRRSSEKADLKAAMPEKNRFEDRRLGRGPKQQKTLNTSSAY